MEHEKYKFMRALMPCKKFLSVNLFDVKQIDDLKYYYMLKLTNEAPITAKPLFLKC